MGLLRPLLEKLIGPKFRGSLARDLVHVPAHELRAHLDEVLVPANMI